MGRTAWLALLVTMVLGIAACGAVPAPENTIQPPGQTGDPAGPDAGGEEQDDIETERQILDKLPAKATVVVPKHPEGVRSVQLADIDGDGAEEALAIYAPEDRPRELHAVLLKEIEGEWTIIWEEEGSGYELDYAAFAEITGDERPEMLLGWTYGASVGNGLDIYAWDTGEANVTLLAQQGYHRIEVENMYDPDGAHPAKELALWQKDTGNAYAVEVYKWDNGELVPAQEAYRAYFPRVADYYMAVLEESPDSAILRMYLADALFRSGDAEEAMNAVREARSLTEDGMLLERLDDLERQIRDSADYVYDYAQIGLDKEQTERLFGDDYTVVAPADDSDGTGALWRYDRLVRDGYVFREAMDFVDIDGLKNGDIGYQLFVEWSNAGRTAGFRMYYADDGSVYEYELHDDGGETVERIG